MRARHLAAAVASLAAFAACTDERRYLGEDGFYQVALAESTPAAFENDEGALFIVEQRIPVPVRVPLATALADLEQGADAYDDLPFPRLPWVGRGDLALEVDFTLSNLDDAERQVAVIANGWNEFHEYLPGVQVIDDEPTPDFAQWERLFELEPHERVSHTIREEDFDEMAVDLATVVNGAPNSNAVVFFENKSGTDERSAPFVPEVVPGLVGFRLGLRATAAARVVLEASVRVRDAGSRLAEEGDPTFEVTPMPFMPVVEEL